MAVLRQELSECESGFKYLGVLRTGKAIRHWYCVLTPTALLASGGQAISVAAFSLGLSTLAAVLAPFLLLSTGLLGFSIDGRLLSV